MKYRNITDAHSALQLDAGFDPFLHGGAQGTKLWKTPTKRALDDLGYPVMSAEYRREQEPSPIETHIFNWCEDTGGTCPRDWDITIYCDGEVVAERRVCDASRGRVEQIAAGMKADLRRA